MAKLSELAGILGPVVESLRAVGTQLEKAKGEIIAALSDVEIPAEAMAKINALSEVAAPLVTCAQKLDDLNPDAP